MKLTEVLESMETTDLLEGMSATAYDFEEIQKRGVGAKMKIRNVEVDKSVVFRILKPASVYFAIKTGDNITVSDVNTKTGKREAITLTGADLKLIGKL